MPGSITLRTCRRVCMAGLGAICLQLMSSACQAQCVPGDQRAPVTEIGMFAEEPLSMFRLMRSDKRKIETKIATYLESDPSLLPALRKLIGNISTEDKRPIGAALRRAVLQCTLSQRAEVARRFDDFVRQLGDVAVTAGYAAVTEEPEFTPSAPRPKPANAPARKDHLFTGQWNLELVDPNADIPLPLPTDSIPQETTPN